MPKNKSNAQKKFEQTVTQMAKNKDAANTKTKAVLKNGVKTAASNYKEGFKDAFNTSGKMVEGLITDVVSGKSPVKGLVGKSLQYGKRELGRIMSTIKGFFNNPDWYKYHGQLAELPYNEIRPFDTKNTRTIQSTGHFNAPGPGVTHYIVNNIVWGDVFDTEAFDLATAEIFRSMREALRSNLNYTITQFRNFVKATISLIAVSKSFEKLLGWYKVVRQDIPELHDALLSLPANYKENGIVHPVEIPCLSDTFYSQTLNAYKVLQGYCKQIAVPKKMVEYISWWVGSTFIDQSQPNPQLYSNILRKCPMYTIDANGDLLQMSDFDITSTVITYAIEQAKLILNNCGIINADLIKTGAYTMLDLVNPDDYNPVAIDDPEFFNVLINSYNVNAGHQTIGGTNLLRELYQDDFIRVDMLPQLDRAHSLGAAFAAAYAFGLAVPFRVYSQAAYINTDSGFKVPTGQSGKGSANQNNTINVYSISGTDNFYIQHTGSEVRVNNITTTNATAPVQLKLSYNQKYEQGATPPVITNMSLTTARSWSLHKSIRDPSPVCIGYVPGVANSYLNLQFNGSSYSFYCGCSSKYNADGTQVVASMSNWVTAQTIDAEGYAIYELKVTNGSTSGISDTTLRSAILQLLTVGSNILQPSILETCLITTSVSTYGLAYDFSNSNLAGLFCELVDYHIPVITYDRTDYTLYVDSSTHYTTKFGNTVKLLKECYVPVSISSDNIKYCVYSMLLGLFSMS